MNKLIFSIFLLSASGAGAVPVVTPLNEVIPKPLQENIRRNRRRVRLEPLGPDREKRLEERDTPVKTQFGGTCTTHGLLAAMENLTGGKQSFSARYFWSHYRQYSAPVAVRTGYKVSQIDEQQWPPAQARSPKTLVPKNVALLQDAPYLGANLTSILASLDRGFPVYIATTVLQDMYACKGTISPRSSVVAGAGHAYAIVGYKVDRRIEGGGYLLAKNSWGTGCGYQGYQWVPFAICTRSDTYCAAWSIRAVQLLNLLPKAA